MEKRMRLNDTWRLSSENGKADLDDFRAIMTEMSKATHYRPASTAELTILSRGYGNLVNELDKDRVDAFEDTMCIEDANRTLSTPIEDTLHEELLSETMNNAGFLIEENGIEYYVSAGALMSIFARVNIAGDGVYRNSQARNVFLAEALYQIGIGVKSRGRHEHKSIKKYGDCNCTLVYREIDKAGKKYRKIFCVPTEKYVPVPLTILSDMAEAICDDDVFGKPEAKYWYTDHNISEIIITFPEKAEDIRAAYKLEDDFVPGIMLRSSDTGKSCIEVKSVAFVGKGYHYLILESVKRKHFGKISEEEIINQANELILRNLKVLPELLAELMSHPIYEGDLTTEIGQLENQKKVEKAINGTMYRSGIKKVIGKKREEKLKEELFAEINPTMMYTEYDVAMMLMTCAERIGGMPETLQDIFAEACAKAPYTFGRHIKKEDGEEELYLNPEV